MTLYGGILFPKPPFETFASLVQGPTLGKGGTWAIARCLCNDNNFSTITFAHSKIYCHDVPQRDSVLGRLSSLPLFSPAAVFSLEKEGNSVLNFGPRKTVKIAIAQVLSSPKQSPPQSPKRNLHQWLDASRSRSI